MFVIICLLIIWCFKLHACTNMFPISTAFFTLLYTIITILTVTERIRKVLNLLRHQNVDSKTKIHEEVMSALRLTQLELGRSTYDLNSYLLTLHQFHSYFTLIMFPTKAQSFEKDKSTKKYQTTDLIQSLESICLYILRGSYTVLLNHVRDPHHIMSLILSSKLHKKYISNSSKGASEF